MNIKVGDKVQIVNGGIDVTNGKKAISGKYYGEDGPLWATVDLIDENWYTAGKFGLPLTVTKVRCINENVVVWQVRPEDIAENIIRVSDYNSNQQTGGYTGQDSKIVSPSEGSDDSTYYKSKSSTTITSTGGKISKNEYVLLSSESTWGSGADPISKTTGKLPNTTEVKTKFINKADAFTKQSNINYEQIGSNSIRKLNKDERKNIGPDITIDDRVRKMTQNTSWQDSDKKSQMLNNNKDIIQNSEAFPKLSKSSNGLMAAKYNYQIIPGDSAFPKMVKLEDKLMQARASLGIQVHGHNNIARAVKYYMYNRFKTPDINLAHNKSVTHVFFTRPDLNILTPGDWPTANEQTMNHSETALLWRKNPELFKLLTDCTRCGDNNNFNMLLSNQVTSFDIKDEEISSVKAGMSWNDYEMVYGDAYTGRAAGEFTCNFMETSDYSIINLIKLWITYIDNVARGAWSPSYQLKKDRSGINRSHVFTKTLDYASSVYVFKCGPDGEDILYWSKYYGVFPMNTGANALNWDNDSPIGTTPKLNIRFAYSFKKDLSPISLIEFNKIARIDLDSTTSENSFNVNFGHSSRPYVGAPFIQMNLNNDPHMRKGGVHYGRKDTSIRLKFRPTADAALTDKLLYRSYMN